jgi:uncharacterized protein YbjT (DUF2867 family)
MKVLVIGATGGSGRAAVRAALDVGLDVTAFARHASALSADFPQITTIDGDATDPAAVHRATEGHDAVIVTLGISESAVRVRLLGSRGTPMDIRSRGTQNVVRAMRDHGVRRLVVQTSFGVGETRSRLRLVDRLVFKLLLKAQIDDTEVQEEIVRASELDWVLVQPVHLTDGRDDTLPRWSTTGEQWAATVTRSSVGMFLVRALEDEALTHKTVALSGSGEASSARERSQVGGSRVNRTGRHEGGGPGTGASSFPNRLHTAGRRRGGRA